MGSTTVFAHPDESDPISVEPREDGRRKYFAVSFGRNVVVFLSPEQMCALAQEMHRVSVPAESR